MKLKGLCIALIFIFILSFTTTAYGAPIQPNMSNDIKVITSKTNLKVGELGFITIQGKPGTRYSLRTTYEHGDRTFSVEQIRVTNASGEATFNWVVEKGTSSGSHSAVITGGGSSITVKHSVKE